MRPLGTYSADRHRQHAEQIAGLIKDLDLECAGLLIFAYHSHPEEIISDLPTIAMAVITKRDFQVREYLHWMSDRATKGPAFAPGRGLCRKDQLYMFKDRSSGKNSEVL